MKRSLPLLAILAIAVIVRLLDVPSIFSPAGHCLAGGPDAYYQLRRAELAAEGTLGTYDAWTNFPEGDEVHWPAPYAYILAGALTAAGTAGLMAVPILAALAALSLFFHLARRLDPAHSLYATLVYALIPAAVYPTLMGAIDHHCLEGFFLIAAISAAGSGVSHGPADGRRSLRETLWRGLCGVAIGAVGAGFITAWPVACVAALATCGLRAIAASHFMHPRSSAVVLALAAVAVPLAGWRYFATPWFGEIEEARPLIKEGIDIFKAVVMLSPGIALMPVSVHRWWRRFAIDSVGAIEKNGKETFANGATGAACAALAATAVALPLALLQARFLVILAVPAALAVGEAVSFARDRYGARAALFLAFISLLPVGRGLYEITQWKPDPLPDVHAALIFLRDSRPSPGDYLDPTAHPQYGVVAAWDLGHHILAIGRHPAVANAFHTGTSGRELAHTILFSDPVRATATADSISARYLFLTDLGGGGYAKNHRRHDQPRVIESLFGRLYYRGESALGWKLVHAADHGFVFEDIPAPRVQIWERDTSPERIR